MAELVPTMDSRGFLSEISAKADKVFTDFCSTNATQSNEFRGQITSMQNLIEAFPNDLPGLCDAIKDALNRMYAAYFDNSAIIVSYAWAGEVIANSTGDSNIIISGTITQDNQTLTLNEALRKSGLAFSRISQWTSA